MLNNTLYLVSSSTRIYASFEREKLHVDTSPQEVVLSTTEWKQAQTEHARRSKAGQDPPLKLKANGPSHTHFVYRYDTNTTGPVLTGTHTT